MALSSIADEYFSKLNPIASRMYADMKETKLAYEELWDTISEKEQKQLLSETIMTPEISMKYPQNANEQPEYAVKFIIDDHCSYRDEHSGPFSFKTKSQRDLTLFDQSTEKAQAKKAAVLKPKPKVQKIVDVFMDNATEFNREQSSSSASNTNSLPKTGLDFLDNW